MFRAYQTTHTSNRLEAFLDGLGIFQAEGLAAASGSPKIMSAAGVIPPSDRALRRRRRARRQVAATPSFRTGWF